MTTRERETSQANLWQQEKEKHHRQTYDNKRKRNITGKPMTTRERETSQANL